MSLFFNTRQRQGVADVIDALQRLEDDPEQLSLQRAHRYSDPPPAYPSSGETTQPPSPAEASVDESALRGRRNAALLRSVPYEQFESQMTRERERIIYQLDEARYGRRQTLPVDRTVDLIDNARNNVRARWVEQGIWIWYNEGAPAWEPDTLRWGHEKETEPQLPPEPAPEPEAKPIRNIFVGWGREETNTVTEESERASALDVTETPAAISERDTLASRPYHQFLFQVSKEREWIKDELQFKPATGMIDLDAMAYESVKKIWIEDEIWNPTWGELPGMTWTHEDLFEKLRSTSRPQHDAANKDEQNPRLPSPGFLKPGATPSVYNNGTYHNNLSSVLEEVDASNGVIARVRGKAKRTKGTARQPAVKENPRSAEETAGRVLWSVRSSKLTKPSTSRKPEFGDVNLRRGGEKASTQRPIRTRHQRQLRAPTENAPSQSPSTGALNYTEQGRPAVEDHLPVTTGAPRRSERIAARRQHTPIERERKMAASSTGNSEGRSRSTPRATSTRPNSNRIRKRQRSSKRGTHARGQPIS